MKQEAVDIAMDHATIQMKLSSASISDARCVTAITVHSFLTGLINNSSNYFTRQILRTARGLVVQWQKKHQCQ